ncbi:hypothetical protein Tco_1211344 [Tanacetum coccineum]
MRGCCCRSGTYVLLNVMPKVPEGIFINQSKYASEIVKKYGLLTTDSVDTPLVEKSKLDEDLQGKQVDATLYCQSHLKSTYNRKNRSFDTLREPLTWVLVLEDTVMSLRAYADVATRGGQDIRLYIWNSILSAIALCYNNVQHSRAKQIDVRYHFIKEQVENGIVELYFIRTEYRLANIFTKPLPRERFNFLVKKLGVRSMPSETLKRLAEETDE